VISEAWTRKAGPPGAVDAAVKNVALLPSGCVVKPVMELDSAGR
jgi:hypothetical protein